MSLGDIYAGQGTSERGYTYRNLYPEARVLDVLQRPIYSIANLFEELVAPEKRTAKEIVMPLYKRRLPEEAKGDFGPVVDLWPIPEKSKGVAKLLLQIGLDPATYTGMGSLTAQGKAGLAAGKIMTKGIPLSRQIAEGTRGVVTFAGKGIGTGERAAKLVEMVGKGAEATRIPGVFRRGSKVEAINQAIGEAMKAGRVEEAKALVGTQQTRRALSGAAKSAGAKVEEIAPGITENIERGRTFGTGDVERLVREHNQYIQDLERRIELNVPELADVTASGDALEYILHRTTERGGKTLGGAIRKAEAGLGVTDAEKALLEAYYPQGVQFLRQQEKWIPKLSPAHTSVFARGIRGKTAEELNAIARDLKLPEIWEQNPARLESMRWRMATRATAKSTYLSSVATGLERAGFATAEDIKGWKGLSPEVYKHLRSGKGTLREKLETLKFPTEIHDDIVKYLNAYIDPKSPAKWLRGYDKMMGTVKWLTLQPFAPFHVRNAGADRLWFTGLDIGFAKAMKAIDDGSAGVVMLAKRGFYGDTAVGKNLARFDPIRGAGKLVKAITGEGPMTEKWLDEAMERGVVGTGFVSGEVGKAMGKFGGAVGKYVDEATAVGRVTEDVSRFGHFAQLRRMGLHPEEAAGRVLKMHGNYGATALAPGFEKEVLNRAFFFWRWTRFNIPGSIRNLFEHWGKHTAIAKSIRAIEEGLPTGQEKYMPDWMKQSGPVQMPNWMPIVGGKPGEPRYMLTKAWWPFAELTDIARPVGAVSERLSPMLRVAGEVMSGRDWYYKKPIREYPGQERPLIGKHFNVPPEVAYALRQPPFRAVGEASRLVSRMERAKGPKAKAEALAASLLLGSRSYTFNPEREAAQRFFESIPEVGKLQSAYKAAENAGDYKRMTEIERLLDELKSQQEEYREAAGIR